LVDVTRISLVKPTLQTPYHVDFNWWSQNDRNWRVYLRNYLCPEHQKAYESIEADDEVDWIDPETAEVHRVDGIQNTLITHCAKADTFITQYTTLVDSVFRLFLASGNAAQTSIELGEHLGRDPKTILRTLSGTRVYKGIRPF